MPKLSYEPNRSTVITNSCSTISSSDKLVDSESVTSLFIHDGIRNKSSGQIESTVNRMVTTYSMEDSIHPSCDQKISKTTATTAITNLPSCSKTTISHYPDSVNFDQNMDDTLPSPNESIPSDASEVQSVTADKIQASLSFGRFLIYQF